MVLKEESAPRAKKILAESKVEKKRTVATGNRETQVITESSHDDVDEAESEIERIVNLAKY
jgi:hypothetical protein